MISDVPKQPHHQAGLIRMKQNLSKRCNDVKDVTNAPQILPRYVRSQQIMRHCEATGRSVDRRMGQGPAG